MSYSTTQQLFMAIIPKISGTVGMFSSLFIISEIYHDCCAGDMNPIKRALLGVTCFEICGSFGWFLSSWALPKGTDFVFAIGTTASCNFQGVLLQLAIGAPLFNGLLQYLFFALVKGKHSQKEIHFIERTAHSIIFVFVFSIAFLLLGLKQYNPTSQVCLINGYPLGCNEAVFGGSDVPCERGFHAHLTGIFLFYIVIWSIMAIIVYMNINMFLFLSHSDSQEARWVVIQGLLFSSAFAITWTPSSVASVMIWFGRGGFHLDVLMALFEPLQGFWNLLIVLRSNAASRQRLISLLNCSSCRSFVSYIGTNTDTTIANDTHPSTDMFDIDRQCSTKEIEGNSINVVDVTKKLSIVSDSNPSTDMFDTDRQCSTKEKEEKSSDVADDVTRKIINW